MAMRKIIFFVVLVFAMVLMSACSKEEMGQETESPSVTPPGDSETAKPVDYSQESAELVFYSYGNAPEESFNSMYGDSIRKRFPNFTIKYVQRGNMKIEELLGSGQRIDIYFDSIANYPMGMFSGKMEFDMTDLIRKHQLDLSRFEQTAVDAMQQMSNGGMYGVPVSNTTRSLYYNKDLFDKFGMDYPEDGMGWEDVFDLARLITRVDDGTQYIGIGTSAVHPIRMNPLSLPLLDPATGKSAIGLEGWRKVFTNSYIRPFENITDKSILKGNYPGCFGPLATTKVMAMCLDLSSHPTVQIERLSAIEWDMVSTPTYVELPKLGNQLYPTYFSITSMAVQKDAAMEVIKHVTSDEYQIASAKQGVMPGVKDIEIRKLLGQESLFKAKNWQNVYYYDFAPISYKTNYDYDLEAIYVKSAEFMQFVRGELDINTYFRIMEEEANAYLKEKEVFR